MLCSQQQQQDSSRHDLRSREAGKAQERDEAMWWSLVGLQETKGGWVVRIQKERSNGRAAELVLVSAA
jgi:hypothetical protein